MRISDWSSDVCSSDLANHRVAGLAVEGLRERGHVRRRADRAEAGQGVLVGLQALVELFRGEVAAPHRRPAQEEALVAGQAVGHRIGRAGGGLLHRIKGRGQARSEEPTSELQSLISISYA